MALDANIPLMVRPAAGPMQSMGQALSLKSMLTQQQLHEQQLMDAQRARDDRATLADLYRGAVGPDGKIDSAKLYTGAAQAGLGYQIPALRKQEGEAQKVAAEVGNLTSQARDRDWGLLKKQVDAKNAALTSLLNRPNLTHEDVYAVLRNGVAEGLYTAEQGAAAARALPGPDQLRQYILARAIEAADEKKRLDYILPQVENVDLGNRQARRLVDPVTRQIIGEQETVKAPEGFVVGQDGRLSADPGYVQAKSQIAAAGAPRVSVTNTQEKEEGKAVGKFLGEQYADLQKAGVTAQAKLDRANRMEQLLQNISTGKLTGVRNSIAALGDSVGITIDPNLPEAQAFEALSNEMALQARNPSGGAGMPGAMSDKDREFLQNITPNLSKTPEGNRIIIETNRKLAQRDMEVAKLAREYRAKSGTLDDGFFEVLRQHAEKNPLFGQQAAAQTPTTNWRDAGYASQAQAVSDARNAIAKGADKAEVVRRLEAAGIKNHGIR